MAKITGILAMWGLFNSMGRTKRTLKDMPQEGRMLFYIVCLFFVGGFLSPVWKGGAVSKSIEFSKIIVAWSLIFLLITTFDRLRRIIWIQAVSVVVACSACIAKGHDVDRLNGVLGGIYSNPNDLAFAVVLALPFALLFMVISKNVIVKVAWLGAMLIMLFTIFLTASRAGFIDLVISGSVTLYFFAIKGKRPTLLVGTVFTAVLIAGTVGGKLYDRFTALEGGSTTEQSAYGSYQDRMYLMVRAVDAIEHYPIFGIGARNFPTYSGIWRDVHMTYLQAGAEGGIPILVLYLMFFWRGLPEPETPAQAQGFAEGARVLALPFLRPAPAPVPLPVTRTAAGNPHSFVYRSSRCRFLPGRSVSGCRDRHADLRRYPRRCRRWEGVSHLSDAPVRQIRASGCRALGTRLAVHDRHALREGCRGFAGPVR